MRLATTDLLHLLLERAAGPGRAGPRRPGGAADDERPCPGGQAEAHRPAAPAARRVPLSRCARGGALRRQGHQPAPAGAQLLRQRRPAQDRPAPAGDPEAGAHRHRPSADGRGAGTALPAPAQPEVQPGRHHVAEVLLRAPHHRRDLAQVGHRQRARSHRAAHRPAQLAGHGAGGHRGRAERSPHPPLQHPHRPHLPPHHGCHAVPQRPTRGGDVPVRGHGRRGRLLACRGPGGGRAHHQPRGRAGTAVATDGDLGHRPAVRGSSHGSRPRQHLRPRGEPPAVDGPVARRRGTGGPPARHRAALAPRCPAGRPARTASCRHAWSCRPLRCRRSPHRSPARPRTRCCAWPGRWRRPATTPASCPAPASGPSPPHPFPRSRGWRSPPPDVAPGRWSATIAPCAPPWSSSGSPRGPAGAPTLCSAGAWRSVFGPRSPQAPTPWSSVAARSATPSSRRTRWPPSRSRWPPGWRWCANERPAARGRTWPSPTRWWSGSMWSSSPRIAFTPAAPSGTGSASSHSTRGRCGLPMTARGTATCGFGCRPRSTRQCGRSRARRPRRQPASMMAPP